MQTDEVLVYGNSLVSIWDPPPKGVIKINVDASFYLEDKIAKLGVIARVADGQVIFSTATSRANTTYALVGELYAILFGLNLAK
ncbi:hypothetical protein REPUB_Repub01dG0160300 [Reevesia pubescens]